MKSYKILLSACALVAAGLSFTGCSDDDMFDNDGKQAFIVGDTKTNSPWVIGQSGTRWYSRISNDTIYIKVSPLFDVKEELNGVFLKFCVSKGSLVSPDPSIAQDFSVEDGVKYTVTSEDGSTQRTYVVTHALTDFLQFGDGVSLGATIAHKNFAELGYPGTYAVTGGVTDSRLYGDLNGYVSFCGHDKIVILARQYSDPHFDNPALAVQNKDLSVRVFNRDDLTPAGNLNVGSIDVRNMRAISSDWNGVMVASVLNGSTTDLYMWKSPSDNPTLLASLPVNCCPNVDGDNYVQIAGDILGTANITAPGARGPKGAHYVFHFENGQLTDTQNIESGYSSGDSNGFQMISPVSPSAKPDYVIGDCEGSGNNAIKVYYNTNAGATKTIMPNVLQNDYHAWWVGTGASLLRTGARRPYVSSIDMNGKSYTMLLNGTHWWFCQTMVETSDLHTRIPGADCCNSCGAGLAWSFGQTGDHYWDQASHTGYWICWSDRDGLYVQKITCYE